MKGIDICSFYIEKNLDELVEKEFNALASCAPPVCHNGVLSQGCFVTNDSNIVTMETVIIGTC